MKNLNLEVGTICQSLYDTLVIQLHQHLNIKTDVDEVKEILARDLSDEELIKTVKGDPGLLTKNNMIDILRQFSKVFRSKVFFLDLNEDSIQELTAECVSLPNPVFVVFNKDELTASPTFQKEKSRKLTVDYGVDNLHQDSIGRLHIKTPYSGNSSVVTRAQIFKSTTIVTHITDLYNFIKSNPDYSDKSGLMLISDGGPDFNPMSLLNEVFLFRLFRSLHLDFLSVFTYAARYSAFNCVEHLWAPLSNKLASIVFSPIYPGDKNPPIRQRNLSTEERENKERYIFDTAMERLSTVHWNRTTFDDCPVDISVVRFGEDELLYNDYETVKNFLKSPLRDMYKYSNLKKEYIGMFKYIDRHRNEIVFMKCVDRSCCSDFRSLNLESFFRQTNMRFHAPTRSSSKQGHYKTFLEESESVNKKYGDQGQPSAKENLGSCIHCPKLSFFSKTEKKRHESVFHRRQSTNIRIRANSYKCNFETCGEVFGSSSALSRHKIKTNHRARDGGVSTEISAKRRKTTKSRRRPMNLAEFRQKANRFSSSSSEEEEIEEVMEAERNRDERNQIERAWWKTKMKLRTKWMKLRRKFRKNRKN